MIHIRRFKRRRQVNERKRLKVINPLEQTPFLMFITARRNSWISLQCRDPTRCDQCAPLNMSSIDASIRISRGQSSPDQCTVPGTSLSCWLKTRCSCHLRVLNRGMCRVHCPPGTGQNGIPLNSMSPKLSTSLVNSRICLVGATHALRSLSIVLQPPTMKCYASLWPILFFMSVCPPHRLRTDIDKPHRSDEQIERPADLYIKQTDPNIRS